MQELLRQLAESVVYEIKEPTPAAPAAPMDGGMGGMY
jgi:hypothetical protein